VHATTRVKILKPRRITAAIALNLKIDRRGARNFRIDPFAKLCVIDLLQRRTPKFYSRLGSTSKGMQPFVQGVLMGLGVSVPIGPVNVLIMSYALRSYTKALCLGLGAMSADMLYLALSAFGISQLAKIPIVFACISVFGACFLLYTAYAIWHGATRSVQPVSVGACSGVALYGKGFLINLLNPYVIMFWLSVSAGTARADFALALAGLVSGILAWITLFPLAIYLARSKLPNIAVRAFAYISAFILVFFALKLLYAIIFGKI